MIPFFTILFTPLFGALVDRVGKATLWMIIGAGLVLTSHLIITFAPQGVPMYAYIAIALLGIGYSLVPSAMWPSVPKIIDERILGSAYCVIFWIQNWGLLLVPVIIGKVLDATGGYTLPMVIFSSFGVVAMFIGMLLKIEDKKKGYGLEEANIKK